MRINLNFDLMVKINEWCLKLHIKTGQESSLTRLLKILLRYKLQTRIFKNFKVVFNKIKIFADPSGRAV